jgi:hypothetical protein
LCRLVQVQRCRGVEWVQSISRGGGIADDCAGDCAGAEVLEKFS